MPIYEYVCESCGRVTEALQRLDEAPLAQCGHCGGPLRKLISAPAFQFKGSGWYVTDYARKSGAGAGKSEAARGGESGGASAPAGESGGASAPAGESPKASEGSQSSSAPAKPPSGE